MASRTKDQVKNCGKNYQREVQTEFVLNEYIELGDFLLKNNCIADKICIPHLIRSGDLLVIDNGGNKIKKADSQGSKYVIRNSCKIKFCNYPLMEIKFRKVEKNEA